MRWKTGTPLILVAAAVLSLVGPAGIAGAADASGATASGNYCAAEATDLTAGLKAATTTPKLSCFGSEAAVWKFVTGSSLPAGAKNLADAVRLQSSTTSTSTSSTQARSASVAATSSGTAVLAVLYKDINYGGAVLTLYSSTGNTCPNGSTYGFPNLGSYGWNDTASSISASSCQTVLYQNINYGGSTFKCNGNCTSVGSMNDAASSVILKKLNS